MQSEDVLVWDGFGECKQSALIVVHALIRPDLDSTFDNVDFVVLEFLDDPDDFCEKPIIVALLICKVPPILGVPHDPHVVVWCILLNDLLVSPFMFFLCLLCQECFPSTFLGVLACLKDLLPLVTCPVYGDIPPIIHLDHPHLLLSFPIVVGYDSRDSQTDGGP